LPGRVQAVGCGERREWSDRREPHQWCGERLPTVPGTAACVRYGSAILGCLALVVESDVLGYA